MQQRNTFSGPLNRADPRRDTGNRTLYENDNEDPFPACVKVNKRQLFTHQLGAEVADVTVSLHVD